MPFGTELSDEFDPHDPFALVTALKLHQIATKRMAQEVRRKVVDISRQHAEGRRHQQQSAHVTATRLHKIKAEIHLVRSTAPPSAASQFDITAKDFRTPRPSHRGCIVQSVAEWAKTSPRRKAGASSDLKTSPMPIKPSPPPHGASGMIIVLDERRTSGTFGDTIRMLSSQPVGGGRNSRGGGGGDFGGTCATLVPLHDGSHHLSLPSIDRLSIRVISNAEQDFSVLSYGNTHASVAVFKELPDEYVLDLSGRRVPVVQFIKYFERTHESSLSFPAYLHLVYSHPLDDCITASKQFSQRFGWAAGLSEETARLVLRLWIRWTDDGNIPFTLERFLEMQNTDLRSTRRYAEMVEVFQANDVNGDGVLDKDEFAKFFAGGESGAVDGGSPTPLGPSMRVSPHNTSRHTSTRRSLEHRVGHLSARK
jgi:hypothetical protein